MTGFRDILIDKKWRPFFRPAQVRVLVVTDGSIGYGDEFGIGKAITEVRAGAPFYARIAIDLARRDLLEEGLVVNAGADQTNLDAKYVGFRFDHAADGTRPADITKHILYGYDQVWLFGINLESDTTTALQPAELAALTRWMEERDGGVFATGDHETLGAAMCMDIPRVRSMRKWRNTQGVPGFTDATRFDTNRPANAAQASGMEVIPGGVQRDAVPQPLEVRRYYRARFTRHGIMRTSAPHPLLCGGEALGVIDVFPDHPHEGCVYEDADVVAGTTPISTPEYPGSIRPHAIAWANTLGDPDDVQHDKGATEARRFAVLGAYNGHPEGIGRVVVDSTWHHWMGMNIDGLGAARATAAAQLPTLTDPNQIAEARRVIANYEKVIRFFINLAVWLAPPVKQRSMLAAASWGAMLHPALYEELTTKTSTSVAGKLVADVLSQYVGSCQVDDWTRVFPYDLEFRPRYPAIPLQDDLRDHLLGGIAKALLPARDEAFLARARDRKLDLAFDKLEAAAEEGALRGLGEGRRRARADLEQMRRALEEDARKLQSVQWSRLASSDDGDAAQE